jgi:radical SAM family uncharacterized protein/radical SAM-linked protein
MPVAWESIEPLLMRVEKPARYVGGEFNQVVKAASRVRACLAFPDIYEIGMSYHGFRLLYERINARAGWAAERAFAPWPDFEALLREHGLPLYSMETRRSLAEFDWIGFTLQHESNFTNVLTMLDLAGIPLESRDRTATFPIVVGGGEGAYSPEPLSPFIDAFVVGDGEIVCLEIMAAIERAREEGWDRHATLRHLAALPGVYVPEFYEAVYDADGTIASFGVRRDLPPGLPLPPPRIHRRHFDIAADLGSTRPVVPLTEAVQDRLAIEIRRGCVNGCRFCQAGMINRPVRERPVGQVVESARQGLAATGYDEVSMLSLSSADHTRVAELLTRMGETFGPAGVSVSLPSLRIDGFDVALADEVARVRKSGFTFAPEAGTTRLRRVINKPVDRERFFEIIDDVFRRGWRTVKFYFMLGLPTETREDLDGIVETCARAAELGRRHHGGNATVNVTLSPFVPKANTPFQWEAQLPREELEARFQYARGEIARRCGRRVAVRAADIGQSFLEACLARGDRRVGRVMRRAWELGARLDGWHEHFRLDAWLRAFEECGLDPAFYANRQRGENEIFPFEHVDAGLGRRFLWADRRRALAERDFDKCDTGPCVGCEACNDAVRHSLACDMAEGGIGATACATTAKNANANPAEASSARPRKKLRHGEAAHPMPPPVQRLRLTHDRDGGLRYLSHLDFVKAMLLVMRRAGAPLAHSHGYTPMPRVQFAPPLSLGMAAEGDLLDMLLAERADPDSLLDAMRAIGLAGLVLRSMEEVPLRVASLEASILASRFRLEWRDEIDKDARRDFAARVERFLASEAVPVEIAKKDKVKQLDLRQSVSEMLMEIANGRPVFHLSICQAPGSFVKPHVALAKILDRPVELGIHVRAARVGLVLAPADVASPVQPVG